MAFWVNGFYWSKQTSKLHFTAPVLMISLMFLINYPASSIQKQLPEVFCKKKMFLKFRKFHKKTPVLESLFNEVAGLKTYCEEHLRQTASNIVSSFEAHINALIQRQLRNHFPNVDDSKTHRALFYCGISTIVQCSHP